MTGKMGENEQKRLSEGSVNITIYDIPTELLHEFGKKVIEPLYKGGISEAIKDIMQKQFKNRNRMKSFRSSLGKSMKRGSMKLLISWLPKDVTRNLKSSH